jgi:hypothetical protein
MMTFIAADMNKLFPLFVVIVISVTSCNTPDFSGTSAMISGLFDATSCEISPVPDNAKVILIELVDPIVLEGYATEKIQSTSALVFYRNLSGELQSYYNGVVVGVSRSGALESKSYSVEELKRADQAVYNAAALLDWDTQKGISEVALVVDNQFISDSMLQVVREALIQLDSANGFAEKKLITGFRADKFRDTGEEVTVVWGEAQRANSVDDFTFYMRASNGKVVFMSVD